MEELTWNVPAMREGIAALRARSPFVYGLTNYVAANLSANVLLAVGAGPAIGAAADFPTVFPAGAGAVWINTAALISNPAEPVVDAARTAHAAGTPWVLDPVAVGAGATEYDAFVASLLEHRPTVIRGNASELIALAGGDSTGKGVDTTVSSGDAVDAVEALLDVHGELNVRRPTVHGRRQTTQAAALRSVEDGIPPELRRQHLNPQRPRCGTLSLRRVPAGPDALFGHTGGPDAGERLQSSALRQYPSRPRRAVECQHDQNQCRLRQRHGRPGLAQIAQRLLGLDGNQHQHTVTAPHTDARGLPGTVRQLLQHRGHLRQPAGRERPAAEPQQHRPGRPTGHRRSGRCGSRSQQRKQSRRGRYTSPPRASAGRSGPGHAPAPPTAAAAVVVVDRARMLWLRSETPVLEEKDAPQMMEGLPVSWMLAQLIGGRYSCGQQLGEVGAFDGGQAQRPGQRLHHVH